MDVAGDLAHLWNAVCCRNGFEKITAFSEDLLNAIEGLDRWPDRVRIMQPTGSANQKAPASHFN